MLVVPKIQIWVSNSYIYCDQKELCKERTLNPVRNLMAKRPAYLMKQYNRIEIVQIIFIPNNLQNGQKV